eukprot:m.90851 g.90851  ORF g.90851 m.90851 type:complete len:74 (+) comp51104_c0_seq1:834-1055(+)
MSQSVESKPAAFHLSSCFAVTTPCVLLLLLGIPFYTPEQIFLGYPAPTPSELYQPAFEEDWCNKGDATPWCSS